MIIQYGTFFLDIFHSLINASAFLTKIHDRTDIFRCNHDLRFYHRFFHIINLRRIRHIRRICQIDHFSVCFMDFVNYTRRRCYEIQIIFPLQTFLDNLKVKKSEKSAAESKPKSDRCFRFKLQRRIVEL